MRSSSQCWKGTEHRKKRSHGDHRQAIGCRDVFGLIGGLVYRSGREIGNRAQRATRERKRFVTTIAAGANLIEQAVIDVDDLTNCIEKLYRNPALVKQYAEAGLAFARTLTWDNLMPKWLQLIGSAIGAAGEHRFTAFRKKCRD
jgi:hypothetical protein